MIYKIEDALFSTVFKDIEGIEKTKLDNLFPEFKICEEATKAPDVSPLFLYYREFIKGKPFSVMKN